MPPRTRQRNVPLLTAIAATLVALALVAVHTRRGPLPGLAAIEGLSIDARFKARGPRPPSTDRIVIVALDDQLRDEAPDVMQTRRGYARLIDVLDGYAPKVIALDVFFTAPEVVLPYELEQRVRELDAELSAATATVPAPTPTAPATPPRAPTAQPPDAPVSPAPLEPPPASAVEPRLAKVRAVIRDVVEELRGDEILATAVARSGRVYLGAVARLGPRAGTEEPAALKRARHGDVADAGGGGARRPTRAEGFTVTMPAIAAGAIGAGVVNNYLDEDGVTRRMPLAVEFAGRHYMPLGLAVALAELGRPGDTAYVVGSATLTAAGRALPVAESASLVLDVMGRDQVPHVSAADVLAGRAPRAALEGKLVFVGFTFAASDKIATPLDRVADGVELHATLAENILGGRLLRGTGDLATVLATLLLCAIVCGAQLRRVRRRAWAPPLIALAAIVAYIGLAFWMFSRGTVIAVAAPAVLATFVMVAATIGGLATEGREKARLRATFSQYVAGPVVDRILADPARATLGGERKELTVLFSDIRGFSRFAEEMTPEELASFLAEYLTPMTELVMDSGGTLDKYIGDAVMAIWGAPIDMPDHASRACDVALRMQDALEGLNAQWARAGKPQLAIGIGLNTGSMAVGNMGTASRFDYTVLGDQVNLGARLEALTKEYGVGILVGEATAVLAGDGYVFREIDLVRVKGRAGAAPVFELVGRRGARVEPAFQDALAAYRRGAFDEARATFATLDGDPVAAALATRSGVLAAAPPPDDWDGVYDQRSK